MHTFGRQRAGTPLAMRSCMMHAARQPTDSSRSTTSRQPITSPGSAPDSSNASAARAERSEIEVYYRTIAPFYDAEQADRDDLDFWRTFGERHRGSSVLELGAGSGRVTEVLAPTAGELIGIDLSPEL